MLDSIKKQPLSGYDYPQKNQGVPPDSMSYKRTEAEVRSALITIVTDEGDVVNLSRLSLRSEAASLEQHRTTAGNSQGNFTMAALQAEGFGISVEGDLNEAELLDLKNLLDDLSAISSDFFSGRMDQAVAGALSIGDMGSLHSLSATFSHSLAVSTQMTQNHYMPALGPDDLKAMDEWWKVREEFEKSNPPKESNTDLLKGQWAQISDFLQPPETARPQPPAKEEILAAKMEPVEKMMERAKETVAKNPRLSPFMPSIAALAIDRFLGDDSASASNRTGRELKDRFLNEYGGWLLG